MRDRTGVWTAVLRVVGAALLSGVVVHAQNASPKTNFADQVMAAGPSLYLNFNDTTAQFRDGVSGLTFGGSAPATYTAGSVVGTIAAPGAGGVALNATTPVPVSGALNSVTVTYNSAPPAGQLLTIVLASGGGTSWTVQDSFSVSPAAVAGPQTFVAGRDYTARSVSAGELLGWFVAAGTPPGVGASASFLYFAAGAVPAGAKTYTSYGDTLAISAAVGGQVTSGTVVPGQAGFDSTQPGNTSAAFSYNGFSVAPNDALGSVEWDVPYSLLVHVDRLNWNRTGQLVLASKGDVSGATSWWELYLQMAGTVSELCFSRGSAGGFPNGAVNGICTGSGFDAMPNGLNYDLVVTDAGTGAAGGGACGECASALSLYINGLGPGIIPETATSGSFAQGFGYVKLAVTGGTGYANLTSFASTGGGANCSVTGTMQASGGVPTSVSSGTGSHNFGCTSAPTITLTNPTGTGAVITATTTNLSMNASGLPLMLPGYVSGGGTYGVGGTNAAAGTTLMDEAAIFPGVLSQNEIEELFYQTKFYQGLMKQYATPPLVIFSDDGCQDTDNLFALAELIRAHLLGEVKIIGVEDVEGGGTNPAFYRQELDQAGLNQIPVSVPSTLAVTGGSCTAANESAFDASTAQSTTAYESSVTMYRTLFAEYPKTPIVLISGGSVAGMVEFMQSPADAISSQTGAQLWAQNAANGGALYGQGLGENYSFGSYYDAASSMYMFSNNGTMPLYWFGGTPQQAGPGVLESRTAKDPLWMTLQTLGSETRSCWDCLTVTGVISSAFSGGVNVSIGGSGTGYANQTPFTSTGGGANCVVTGTMVSVNGVPTSVLSSQGTAPVSFSGLGSGCMDAATPPTIVLTDPTGTGAVLTAVTTASACGTVTQTTATNGVTAQTSCTNEFFVPYSMAAVPGATPVLEWFVNSLDDAVPVGSPRKQ